MKPHVVVLAFEPPGPVSVSHWVAPDAATAAALATLSFMREGGTDKPLMACLAAEMPAEQLRHLLRAAEGRLPESGNADVVSLVREPDPRQPVGGGPPLDAADASTFTGANVDTLWEARMHSLRQVPRGVTPLADMPWVWPPLPPGAA